MKQTLIGALVALMFLLVGATMAQAGTDVTLTGDGQLCQVAQLPATPTVTTDGVVEKLKPEATKDVKPAPDSSDRDAIEAASKTVHQGGYIPFVKTNRVDTQSMKLGSQEITFDKEGHLVSVSGVSRPQAPQAKKGPALATKAYVATANATTLTAAKTYTDTACANAVATANVYTDTALTSAKSYTDSKLASANDYTNTAVQTANNYTNQQVGAVSTRGWWGIGLAILALLLCLYVGWVRLPHWRPVYH
jgi:hypothetical protein